MQTRSLNSPQSDKKRARRLADRARAEAAKNDFHRLLIKTFGKIRAEELFYPGRQWRFDFYIPDFRLAVEIEGGVFAGGRHTRGAGFSEDIEKYNSALLVGVRVYRINALDLRKPELVKVHVQRLLKLCTVVQGGT